jgi:chemotaxis methyl-accepting protein methylase
LGLAGLDAARFQARVLERRTQACFRWLGVRSDADARELLESRPHLLREVLDVALIGVTSFLRDGPVFSALEREIGQMAGSSRPGRRVLSAGSAEGQELYSVAMLLEEAGILGSSDLVGVDSRPAAIARAREGRFREPQLEGLDPARRARHLRRVGTEFAIGLPLHERSRWYVGDLFTYREDRPFDILLCRNVAIYLTWQSARVLWAALARQVSPGGLLVTGKAEKPPRLSEFDLLSPCIYRKTT